MKIIEDYGWEQDQYVVEKKQEPAGAPVAPVNAPGASVPPGSPPLPPSAQNTPPVPNIPLAGRAAGAELSQAMKT